MHTDDNNPIRGGQGREERELVRDAANLLILLCIIAAVAMVIAIFSL